MSRDRVPYAGAILIILTLLLIVCAPTTRASPPVQSQSFNATIRMAGQFGLIYAPITVALDRGIFERYGIQAEFQQFGSGGAIREALVAGQTDIGFMALPPFLIGWDKGVAAKIALGFNTIPSALVTNDPNIVTLRDFTKSSKIAVPSPGSVQDVMIAMAAQKELGSSAALQERLVTMPQPDAMAALIAKKDLVAHYANPPYLFEELAQPGFHEVINNDSVFGNEYSFNVAVVSNRFAKESPLAYAAFVQIMNEAMVWINENKADAAKLLASEFKLTPEKTLQYLNWQGMNFTSAPYGLMGFGDFMKEAGYVKRAPKRLSDIATNNVLAVVGSRSGGPSLYERLQYRR